MTMPCTQSERIISLEISQKQMVQDISEIKTEVKAINAKFDVMIDKMEKKFASKRVEWIVKWLIGLILVTVFGALLAQIIIK